MQWQFIIAIILAVPVILFPAAFVWYLNGSGMYMAFKRARERRAVLKGVADAIGVAEEASVETGDKDRGDI